MMRFLLLTLALLVPSLAEAGTYWVSPTGAADWASCASATPLSGASACSMATANANAVAGDTVYFRGGTYNFTTQYAAAIYPRHSGTSAANMITFVAYEGEQPLILCSGVTDAWGVLLEGISYFKLDGFTIKNFPRFAAIMASSHHNEIARNIFTGTTGEEGHSGLGIYEACVGGSSFTCPSTHNWIHHNTFAKVHTKDVPNTCIEGADLVRIGYPYPTGNSVAGDDYNSIENNIMYHGGHTTFDGYGLYTVFRNNIMHNEPWWSSSGSGCTYSNAWYSNPAFRGKYGHRTFQITDGYRREGTYALVEGNRAGFASANPNNDGADGMDIAAPRNIVRYNDIFAAMESCLMFKYGWGSVADGNGGSYNRMYNNTLYHCGYGNPFFEQSGILSTMPEPLLAIRFYRPDAIGNVIKNNLIYDSRGYALNGSDVYTPAPAGTVMMNNWLTPNGDPLFVNPSLADPTSTTLPNLALQAASGAINGGTHLTQARGAGVSSTTLVVDDALYFQDGTWGSDLARLAGAMRADWIAVGTVSNVVQISRINYATNTITLASSITWADRAPIWLYRKSDGVTVLVGPAPDYGAHEYGIGAPQPPTKVIIRTP